MLGHGTDFCGTTDRQDDFGICPGYNNDDCSRHYYIEKAPLIAQWLGKLSGIIAAYRTAVRLGPMSETGHSHRFNGRPATSDFTPTPDMPLHRANRRDVPKPEVPADK